MNKRARQDSHRKKVNDSVGTGEAGDTHFILCKNVGKRFSMVRSSRRPSYQKEAKSVGIDARVLQKLLSRTQTSEKALFPTSLGQTSAVLKTSGLDGGT